MTTLVEQVEETEEQEPQLMCENCENLFDESSDSIGFMVETNRYLCNDCYSVCGDCGTSYDPTYMWNSYPSRFCSSCAEDYITCEYCDNTVHTDDTTCVDEEEYWCDRCALNYAHWCDDCDFYHRESTICDSESPAAIRDYSYKPEPVFFGADWARGIAYLGMELEIEVPGDTYDYATRFMDGPHNNMMYLKHDGSLSNGFEIVTHPMTHDCFVKSFPWDKIEELRQAGARSWSTGSCGIHIHISRSAFLTSSHMWRFAHFIHNNQRFVTTIAGRHSDRWASFDPDHRANIGKLVKGQNTWASSRYTAVNFTNSFTLEIRVFRGSMKRERIQSAADFVDAVFEYTRTLPYQDIVEHGLSPARFVAWVRERADKYSGLNYIINYYDELDRNFY